MAVFDFDDESDVQLHMCNERGMLSIRFTDIEVERLGAFCKAALAHLASKALNDE